MPKPRQIKLKNKPKPKKINLQDKPEPRQINLGGCSNHA